MDLNKFSYRTSGSPQVQQINTLTCVYVVL